MANKKVNYKVTAEFEDRGSTYKVDETWRKPDAWTVDAKWKDDFKLAGTVFNKEPVQIKGTEPPEFATQRVILPVE